MQQKQSKQTAKQATDRQFELYHASSQNPDPAVKVSPEVSVWEEDMIGYDAGH